MINLGESNIVPSKVVVEEEVNSLPQEVVNVDEYKRVLRELPEVQALTNEIEIQNPNSILVFGQKPSEAISRISSELLSSMKSVKSEEVSEMLIKLTKVMDQFDIKELEAKKEDKGFLAKVFNKAQTSIQKMFEKYEDMGKQVDEIYILLKKYESDIQKSNTDLKRMLDANVDFFKDLERYVVAGEMALEEIEQYKAKFESDYTISEDERNMMIQKLNMSQEMLAQRVYDLQVAENVALQACPMINTMQFSNFNLMRKINSSFIITLPIFKQCLIQSITLRRQDIQAKSIKALDDKTNELLVRNANLTSTQSVKIAKMAAGSSIQIETLEKTYQTIKAGIEETKQIQAATIAKRKENSIKLEHIKKDIKKELH